MLLNLVLPIGVLAPLVLGLLLFLFGWLLENQPVTIRLIIGLAAIIGLAGQLVLGAGIFSGALTPEARLFTWTPLPDFSAQMAFRADLISFYFALPLAILTFLLILYLISRAPTPEAGDGILPGRLYGLLFMAEGAGLAAIYSADLLFLYMWLEVVGLTVYLLAGPGARGASSERTSYQALGVSVFAGFLILSPFLVIISRNGGKSLYTAISPASIDLLFLGLIAAGLVIKAAQFPFQTWLAGFSNLPAAAYSLLTVGLLFPLVLYVLVRVQTIAADRYDVLKEVGPGLLLIGALTIVSCGWLAVRGVTLVRRTALLCAAGFGWVLLALGQNDLPAALWQLFALTLAAPILFLCADQMQIENTTPPNPEGWAQPKLVTRPARYRSALLGLYLLGAAILLGLPLTPGYAARWQTLASLFANQKFYAGLALIGLLLMGAALVQAVGLFLNGVRKSVDKPNALWWPLAVPGLLAVAAIVLGVYPALLSNWLVSVPSRVTPNAAQTLPAANLVPLGWLALVLGAALAVILLAYWFKGRLAAVPAYNGGLLYGGEEEANSRYLLSLRTDLKVYEEELPEGFNDPFFRHGMSATESIRTGPEPRLSTGDYLTPLQFRLRNTYRLFDTSYSGGFLTGILFRIVRAIVWLFEWLTERFYAAFAALTVLLFIILLTR